MVVSKNYLEIIKTQIKLNFKNSILISILFCIALQFVFGMKNLDINASSNILERFASLVGILLFTPIFFPEDDKNIAEVVNSKYISQWKIFTTRILISLVILMVLILGVILQMQYFNCIFPIAEFWLGTVITALFLGSIGFFVYSVTDNLIIGYMLAVMYFIINMFLPSKSLGNFYLFSLGLDSFNEKYWLLAGALLLLSLGVVYKAINKKA